MKNIPIEQELEKVKRACNKYGFSYHESINGIFIRTKSMAGWFIMMADEKPKLLHENYRHKHKYGNGAVEGYHPHTDIREETAEGMVNYIWAHDKAMLRKKQKNIFDNLPKRA